MTLGARLWPLALGICLGVSPATGQANHPRPQTELEQAFYDIGVIGYCGLYNDVVSSGFRREVRRIVERDGIDAQTLKKVRSRAMTMVEQEWDNRGLGGFRGWCRSEGEAAVERFLHSPR